MRAGARFAAFVIGVLGVACATPKKTETEEEYGERRAAIEAIAHLRTIPAAAVAAAVPIGAGFPAELDEPSFRVGDYLLFGIESFTGPKRRLWYLRFQTTLASDGSRRPVVLSRPGRGGAGKQELTIQCRHARVRVTLFDAALTEVARAESELAQDVHEIGLFAHARAQRSWPAGRPQTLPSTRAQRPLILLDPNWGVGIYNHLLHLLAGNDAMGRFVRELSVWPGFFELPRFLSGAVEIYGGFERPRLVPQPIAGVALGEDALEFTTTCWQGGRALLNVNLVIVPPIGPLAITGGIVTATGYRPYETDRRFVMTLIGAGRGGEFTPATSGSGTPPRAGARP